MMTLDPPSNGVIRSHAPSHQVPASVSTRKCFVVASGSLRDPAYGLTLVHIRSKAAPTIVADDNPTAVAQSPSSRISSNGGIEAGDDSVLAPHLNACTCRCSGCVLDCAGIVIEGMVFRRTVSPRSFSHDCIIPHTAPPMPLVIWLNTESRAALPYWPQMEMMWRLWRGWRTSALGRRQTSAPSRWSEIDIGVAERP